jgi:RNA polymerase sigma factor (sigma-70 family)
MHDTRAGGSGGRFPATRRSLVAAARDGDPEVRRQAFGDLVASYWKPAYKYLRARWGYEPADAEDLTQEFFAGALSREVFARYDPAKARFRTFLRLCLDRFAANEKRASRRLKRGGGTVSLSLDFAAAEEELAIQGMPRQMDPEEYFHREWVRALFSQAVDELSRGLAAEGKAVHFALFERYDLEGPDAAERPTYAALAAEHGLTTVTVTNWLAAVRRRFRGLVLDRLRELTGSDEELAAEARAILGVDPR